MNRSRGQKIEYDGYTYTPSSESDEIDQTNTRAQPLLYDLLILYKGSRDSKTINYVEDYGICKSNPNIFWFQKDGYKSFLPSENILFFGRQYDYGDVEPPLK